MDIPDLVGKELNSALNKLKKFENIYNITIKETISPFKSVCSKNSECRVVRQRCFDNTIEITISYF